MGNVGDLMKMVMAKSNLREYPGDVDQDIKHELADCMWALMIMVEELKIDQFSKEFVDQMTTLAEKVEKMVD